MAHDENYRDVLLEDMNGKIDTILEIVVPMRQELTAVKRIVEDIPEIKADIQTIKHVLKITNDQVRDHETRITKLETRAA